MKFKLKLSQKKKVYKKKNDTLNSNFFWNIALYSSFVLIFTSFIFGLLFYKKVNNESFYSEVQIENPRAIKEQEIKQTLDFLKERREKSDKVLNSPAVFVDPSI